MRKEDKHSKLSTFISRKKEENIETCKTIGCLKLFIRNNSITLIYSKIWRRLLFELNS